MQLVTPSVVPMAVRMAMMVWIMNFHVSLFFPKSVLILFSF